MTAAKCIVYRDRQHIWTLCKLGYVIFQRGYRRILFYGWGFSYLLIFKWILFELLFPQVILTKIEASSHNNRMDTTDFLFEVPLSFYLKAYIFQYWYFLAPFSLNLDPFWCINSAENWLKKRAFILSSNNVEFFWAVSESYVGRCSGTKRWQDKHTKQCPFFWFAGR